MAVAIVLLGKHQKHPDPEQQQDLSSVGQVLPQLFTCRCCASADMVDSPPVFPMCVTEVDAGDYYFLDCDSMSMVVCAFIVSFPTRPRQTMPLKQRYVQRGTLPAGGGLS
jgi:hypothetical protein